jgi:endonuclease/exonuclease/phosphatase family metal-dependent hydrolase
MQHYGTRVSLVALRGVLSAAAIAAFLTPPAAAAQKDIVLEAEKAAKRSGKWAVAKDRQASQDTVIRHPDAGRPKITRALARPANYFEMSFQAQARTPYRLWIRGRAQNDHWGNDSVFVQFSGSVSKAGGKTYRIGTTTAAEVNLEECRGCGLRGWKWQDNGWGKGVLGPVIYFAKSGTQKLRVQTREDGLSIDRIVLSPSRYLRTAPSSPGSPAPAPSPSPSPAPRPAPQPSTPPAASSGKVVKVLDWNIHHGVGTDGKYDIQRIAAAIAKTGANVVSLNEVERYTGWGNEDQPARFAAMLKARTGKTWHYNFAQRNGAAKGQGNLLLTTFRIESDDDKQLSYDRSVARIAIIVNGIRVNLFSTHLDNESSGRRSTQMRELTQWADNFPQQRILTGDFNAWPGAGEVKIMTAGHIDAWAAALGAGRALAYAGNAAGNTRNSRIDYVFYSKGAKRLRLTQTRVWDMRDSRGKMPSDHRPVMATFEVR